MSDDDCALGYSCQYGCCDIPQAEGTICNTFTADDLTAYVRACRISGDCNLIYRYAFDTLDMTGFTEVGTELITDFAGQPNENVICCQEGKNCEDGFEGCEPDCNACCDIDACTEMVAYAIHGLFACVDDTCFTFRVHTPVLYVSDDDYLTSDFSSLDYSGINSCDDLRDSRTQSVINANQWCQREDGITDAQLPCYIHFINLDADNENCPSACAPE